MKHYPHHIGDFDKATRHLTRIERSIYRDLIEIYYDTEKPLTLDRVALCRRALARTNEESTAVEQVLNEFFNETPHGWYHVRCEVEIEKYRSNQSAQARAGKASAAARALKAQQALNGRSADVERNAYGAPTEVQQNSTNREPLTVNQEPFKTSPRKFSDDDEDDARAMFAAIQTLNPKHKPPNFEKWADEIRLIRERDNLTREEIMRLFRWANADPFWQSNILSPSKLREKWDVLTIQMTMRKDNGKNQQPSKPSLAERATNARKEYERSIGIGATSVEAIDGELVGANEPHLRP